MTKKKKPSVFCKWYLETFHKAEIEEASGTTKPYLLEIEYGDIREYFKEKCSLYTTSKSKGLHSQDILNGLRDKFRLLTKNELSDVKIIDFPENIELRLIDTNHRKQWISTTAMIKTITDSLPKILKPAFNCSSCGATIGTRSVVNGVPDLPSHCNECGGTHFVIDENYTIYDNSKLVRLEEPLAMRKNGTARSFLGEMTGFIAGPNYNLQAGDECKLTGWLELETKKRKGKNDELSFKFDIYNLKPVNSSYDELKLSQEDMEEMKELGKMDNIFQLLVDSILPSVYGYDEVKQGLVLQLFEGDRSPLDDDNDKSVTTERHNINILLLGEPGIGKSRILELISRVAPKSIKSNGAGTSKAGITGSAVKDELTGTWTMAAGAIVLADSGLLTIDEADKMSSDVMEALNEPMENQSVSVAKAGLVQTMTARTSVLAAANPEYGRYDDGKSFDEQVNIPNTTLTRFDLIYLLRDMVDYERDLDMAKKVLTGVSEAGVDLLPTETIRKYINYTKKNVFPVLSSVAISRISEYYAGVRKDTAQMDDGKIISMRELGALQRLSIAYAKVHHHSVVSLDDVEEAIRIYEDSLKTLHLDIYHAGVIQDKLSKEELECVNTLTGEIRESFEENGSYVSDKDGIIGGVHDLYPNVGVSWLSKMFDEQVVKVKKELHLK